MPDGHPRQESVCLTLHQIEALAIVAGMVLLFVTDRLRYDLVAAIALLAAALLARCPDQQGIQRVLQLRGHHHRVSAGGQPRRGDLGRHR